MAALKGNFYFNDWWPCKGSSTFYTCQFEKEEIKQREITKITGVHKANNGMKDVVGVRFDDCKMTFIPTGLGKLFENLKILLIFNSDITKVTKEDFAELSMITQLWIANCNIEYLPGNLLDLMPKLEVFSIQYCKVKYIDAEIFDSSPNLKAVKLNGNSNIDEFYVDGSADGGISFEELKAQLKSYKITPPRNYDTYHCLPKKLAGNIKSMLANDGAKDVTITIDGEKFTAHGFVLAARCSVLALMIKNGKGISLDGIKKEVFSEILKYFYTDELPSRDTNMVDLVKAAEVLQLNHLKAYGLQHISELNVTQDNAVDMIGLAIEIGSKELQDNAFKEVKKMFPEKKLKDEWAGDVEKVKKILEAKTKMEEEVKNAHEKFDQLFI